MKKMEDETVGNSRRGSSKDGQVKPYTRPRLIHFGAVTQLTRQFSNSSTSDSGNNRMAPFS